jgi:hypothetical protein
MWIVHSQFAAALLRAAWHPNLLFFVSVPSLNALQEFVLSRIQHLLGCISYIGNY